MLAVPTAGSQVVALGHYTPERVMTNGELATMMDTSDEWIRSRVGIQTRHIAGPEDTVAHMAHQAARMAIETGDVDTDEIDMVIVATVTSRDRSPNAAGRVALELGLRGPVILDINTACSGFVHALALADQAIRAGSAHTVLIVGAERLSEWTDWNDRSTAVLLGDGAGAMIVRASDEPRIGPVTWGSELDLTPAIRIESPTDQFAQDGRAIMRWALTRAVARVNETLARSGVGADEIEVFAPHQANLRIIDPLATAAGLEHAHVIRDVIDSGNTSAASIPLALSKAWHSGEIVPNARILAFGFGGGFAYAGLVLRAPAAARVIVALSRPDSGTIAVAGRDHSRRPRAAGERLARQGGPDGLPSV